MSQSAQFGANLDSLPAWTPADEKLWQTLTLRRRAHEADKGKALRRAIFETMGGLSPSQADRMYQSLLRHAGLFHAALEPFVEKAE